MLIVFCIVPITVVIVLNSLAERERLKAETKRIRLENKITQDITYQKLKSESKHGDIKNKIEIFEKLVKLEEEIKRTQTASDQKKLEVLEMIKKEFKETFKEHEAGSLKLGAKPENNLEAKKELNQPVKKINSVKTNRKRKE